MKQNSVAVPIFLHLSNQDPIANPSTGRKIVKPFISFPIDSIKNPLDFIRICGYDRIFSDLLGGAGLNMVIWYEHNGKRKGQKANS